MYHTTKPTQRWKQVEKCIDRVETKIPKMREMCREQRILRELESEPDEEEWER